MSSLLKKHAQLISFAAGLLFFIGILSSFIHHSQFAADRNHCESSCELCLANSTLSTGSSPTPIVVRTISNWHTPFNQPSRAIPRISVLRRYVVHSDSDPPAAI